MYFGPQGRIDLASTRQDHMCNFPLNNLLGKMFRLVEAKTSTPREGQPPTPCPL